MNTAAAVVLALSLVLLGSAALVVWSRRDLRLLRGFSVVIAVLCVLAAPLAIGSVMGLAVPVIPGLTIGEGEVDVIGAKLVTGDAIFVLVDRGAEEPRHYRLPWDKELAERLQGLLDDPANNGRARMKVPRFSFSWDRNAPQFHPMPQPKWLPDKREDPEPQAPHFEASLGGGLAGAE